MKSFKKYNNQIVEDYIYSIIELCVFIDIDESDILLLDEATSINKQIEKLNPLLNKIGLKLSYKKTLIHHAIEAGIGVVKILKAAIDGDKNEIIRLAKNVKKEDIANFLLRLDKATLNLIGGSVGRIEAITGWRLIAGSPVKGTVDLLKRAFKTIIDHLPKLPTYNKGTGIRAKIKKIESIVL